MAFYGNLRIKIRLTINDTTHTDYVRYLNVLDNSTIGDLIDDINTRLEQDNMIGDIYYVVDQQLDYPFMEETLLGGPLFPREQLLIYTMIENGSTLYVNATPINNNNINILCRIYIGETTYNMTLNIPESYRICNLLSYINVELNRQFLTGDTYHINVEEGYQISEQTLLGGTNYPPDTLLTDVSIVNNSILYINCRVTNPLFRSLLYPFSRNFSQPSLLSSQLPILNIDDQAQLMDINSFLDVHNSTTGINDIITSLNSLNSIIQLLSNPIFTNVQLLNTVTTVNTGNRRLDDIVVSLDKNDLEQLKISKYIDFEDRDKNDRDLCSVCFEKFIDSDTCRELKCKHLYHQNCIDKWLSEHITCPVCREECGKGIPNLS